MDICRAFLVPLAVAGACTGTASRETAPPSQPEGPQPATSAEREKPPSRHQDAGKSDGGDEIEEMFAELEDDEGWRLKKTPGCTELVGKDECTGVGAVILVCTALGNILLEPATRGVVACLEERNGTEALCETEVLKDCALEAIEKTPPTSLASSVCDELLAQCPAEGEFADLFTPELCKTGLSSLLVEPRDDFIACMRDSCDLRLCVGGLL